MDGSIHYSYDRKKRAFAMTEAGNIFILVLAGLPAAYLTGVLLFGEPEAAQRLVRSSRVKWTFFFLCGLQIILQIIGAPFIIKIMVFVLSVITFLFGAFFFSLLDHVVP